jgi:uncharacterized membrane protein
MVSCHGGHAPIRCDKVADDIYTFLFGSKRLDHRKESDGKHNPHRARTISMHLQLRMIGVGFVALAMIPAAVSAQTSTDELRSVIQNSVISDPRTANIPPAQLQGLVDALVEQANAQHMTAADIIWRPQQAYAATVSAQATTQASVCMTGIQGYLCNFNQIFGFEGNNYEIPILLLFTSAFLIAVIWEIHVHHRKKMAMNIAKASSISTAKAK